MKTLKLATPMDLCETSFEAAMTELQSHYSYTDLMRVRLTTSIYDIDFAKRLLIYHKDLGEIIISKYYPLGGWMLTTYDEQFQIGCQYGA